MISLVHSTLAGVLGWTLFHSLWQGALIALLLALALTLVRSSRARYAIACLALIAVLTAFGSTFAMLMAKQHNVAATVIRPGSHLLDGPADVATRLTAHLLITDFIPWLTPLWIAGVIAFHLHLLASWIGTRRLRTRGVCPATEFWRQRLADLRGRIRVSPAVTLLESSLADIPMVIGFLQPVILVPVGLFAGMPAQHLEAILLHELAHIRRRDYLANLLQTIAESFLFYHPAVWWISRVIRTERENCCDDLVVATNGAPREYAAALATLEQNRWTAADAVAANGGNLMKRIRRLLYPQETPSAVLTPAVSAIILTLAAAITLVAWQDKPAGANLPKPYWSWLNEDVIYIIQPQEREAFLKLATGDERQHFIEQFWSRRDPTPDTVKNEFKEEHYRRIAYANNHFPGTKVPGWKTDRGRIYIVYGPPDEIESHPAGGAGRSYPFEQWRYHLIKNVGQNIIIDFADPNGSGDYRMTRDPNPSGGSFVHP